MICNLADAMVVIREDYAEIERLRGQVAKLEAKNSALKEEVQMVRYTNALLSEQFMKFQEAVDAKLAKADGLARVLDEAREDLALWHEKWVQRQDGGLASVSCEGCSTCDLLPEIDAALAAYKEQPQ